MNTADTLAPCPDCNATGGTLAPCVACNGRGERRVVCVACNERPATRDGLCDVCDADVDAYFGGLAAGRYYAGDIEGELRVKGYRC